MKKLHLLLLLAAMTSLGFGSAVLAEQDNQGGKVENSIKIESREDQVITTSSIRIEGRDDAQANESRKSSDRSVSQESQDRSLDQDQETEASSTEVSDEIESHRSSVADFVHSLLEVADREPGIGEEVRVIAQRQNESGSTTVKAMKEVEDRNGVKTLLFGTDYKNLGVLRAEIATSSQQIERLKALVLQTTNPVDKASLEAQIAVLEANQVKLDQFIKDHENTFSFLGWFVRLFNN